jgi:hypothetical protein
MGKIAQMVLESSETRNHFPPHPEGGHAIRNALFSIRNDIDNGLT